MPRPSDKTDLLQGTLDLLILQVAALPVHGYHRAAAESDLEEAQVQQGSLYPALIVSKTRLAWAGGAADSGQRRSSTRSRPRAETARGRAHGMGSAEPGDRAGAANGQVKRVGRVEQVGQVGPRADGASGSDGEADEPR